MHLANKVAFSALFTKSEVPRVFKNPSSNILNLGFRSVGWKFLVGHPFGDRCLAIPLDLADEDLNSRLCFLDPYEFLEEFRILRITHTRTRFFTAFFRNLIQFFIFNGDH